jgi:ABC-type uncharacterized transport system auxiliary subunit
MRKRLACLLVIATLLSLFLAACGDEEAAVPTYPGATSITLADSVRTQFTTGLANVKNASVNGFKTSDDIARIKSTFDSNFKSAGWSDVSSQLANQPNVKAFNDAGGFVVGYSKGNKSATVMAVPNQYAEGSGISGLNANENAFIVVSGNPQ